MHSPPQWVASQWRIYVGLSTSTISAVRCELPRTALDKGLAEREGFEPSIRFCRILTFQASAFDHSATAPHSLEGRPSRRTAQAGQGCRTQRRSLVQKP